VGRMVSGSSCFREELKTASWDAASRVMERKDPIS